MGGERGSEYARLPSVETVADPDRSDVPAYYEQDEETNEYIVRASGEKLTYATKDEMLDKWIVVREPFIPENEFDRLPTPEDFVFVVFPDADDEYNEPMICERGKTRPLLPEEIEWDVTEKVEGEDVNMNESEGESGDGEKAPNAVDPKQDRERERPEPQPPDPEPEPAPDTHSEPTSGVTAANDRGSETPPRESVNSDSAKIGEEDAATNREQVERRDGDEGRTDEDGGSHEDDDGTESSHGFLSG